MKQTRGRRGAALACAVLGAALLGSCAQGPTNPPPQTPGEYTRQRALNLQKAMSLAEEAERSQDAAERETLLREAVNTYPQSSAIWTNLGVALAQQEDYAAAAEAFGQAAQLDPTDPRPPYNHGTLYLHRYWYEPAIEHFERALKRDPNYLNAIRGVIRTRVIIRDFDQELLDVLDRALLLEHDERWIAYFVRQRETVRSEVDRGGRSDDDASRRR